MMFLRMFIKTSNTIKANETVRNILSYTSVDNIKHEEVMLKPYWKYDDVTVAEIKLELFRPFEGKDKEDLLNCISNKWVCFGEKEVISSNTMDGCILNFDLEMANIFFD